MEHSKPIQPEPWPGGLPPLLRQPAARPSTGREKVARIIEAAIEGQSEPGGTFVSTGRLDRLWVHGRINLLAVVDALLEVANAKPINPDREVLIEDAAGVRSMLSGIRDRMPAPVYSVRDVAADLRPPRQYGRLVFYPHDGGEPVMIHDACLLDRIDAPTDT